jgi:hypothetical protein
MSKLYLINPNTRNDEANKVSRGTLAIRTRNIRHVREKNKDSLWPYYFSR